MITSRDNKFVKHARSLYNIKSRRKFNQFIAEGTHIVDEAIKSNSIEYVLTINNSYDGYLINEDVMRSISLVNNLSVIAVCNIKEYLLDQVDLSRVLVLENISDPGNLGTLIRSALAFNFTCIICSDDCVDLYNEKVLRATQGMVFHIPVIYCDIIDYLKNSSNASIATVVDGNSDSIKFMNNVNLVIGNEGRGLSDEVVKLCDEKFSIKMNDKVESLNAAVAGSIIMWKIGVEK